MSNNLKKENNLQNKTIIDNSFNKEKALDFYCSTAGIISTLKLIYNEMNEKNIDNFNPVDSVFLCINALEDIKDYLMTLCD